MVVVVVWWSASSSPAAQHINIAWFCVRLSALRRQRRATVLSASVRLCIALETVLVAACRSMPSCRIRRTCNDTCCALAITHKDAFRMFGSRSTGTPKITSDFQSDVCIHYATRQQRNKRRNATRNYANSNTGIKQQQAGRTKHTTKREYKRAAHTSALIRMQEHALKHTRSCENTLARIRKHMYDTIHTYSMIR